MDYLKNSPPGNWPHGFLQKVKGYVDRFTWLRKVTTVVPKILSHAWVVREKLPFKKNIRK
jgi:hypothetical protein